MCSLIAPSQSLMAFTFTFTLTPTSTSISTCHTRRSRLRMPKRSRHSWRPKAMIRTSGPQHLDSWTSPPSSAMEWRPSWKTRLLSVLLYEEGGVIKNYNFNFNWNYYYYRGRGSPFSFTFINSCCILPCSLYTHRERDCYRDRGLSGERPLLSFLFSFLLLTHTYSHTHTFFYTEQATSSLELYILSRTSLLPRGPHSLLVSII